MGISDKLRDLNNEIANRETGGDRDYFEALLHPEFRMRRASGVIVNRAEFIDAVKRRPQRRTKDVTGTELDLTAAVMCVVSMRQNDDNWKSFRNYRVFLRPDTAAAWQLLGWANEPISPQVSIVGQVPLRFTGDEETLKKLQNLSAVHVDGGRLWAACDELTTLERLVQDTDQGGDCFIGHRSYPLGDLGVMLPDGNEKEIDAEGMDLADGYLWVVGSHSRTRDRLKPGAVIEEALQEFAEVHQRPNRKVLFRVALEGDGDDVRPVKETTASGDRLTTAALIGDLTDALKDDDHLKQSLAVPAKENGLDVEGLAVFGSRVLLGLRGPVLRGWALIVEVEPQQHPDDPTRLMIGSPPYRKHFLDLGDLGVRDLARAGEDLLILAGPPTGLDGPVRLFRWHDAANAKDQQIVSGPELSFVGDLPHGTGDDHPEGIALTSSPGEPAQLLVVYDSPSAARLTKGDGTLSILADITSPLPGTSGHS